MISNFLTLLIRMKFDRVLKVAVDHWSPHVYVTIHDNGTIEATGPAAKMLDVIAKSLGFQYVISRL